MERGGIKKVLIPFLFESSGRGSRNIGVGEFPGIERTARFRINELLSELGGSVVMEKLLMCFGLLVFRGLILIWNT